MTSRSKLIVLSACLLVILLHVTAFFLPVDYLGKFESFLQPVPSAIGANTQNPPLFEFRLKSLSYLWSNLLLVNAVVSAALASLFIDHYRFAKYASLLALVLAVLHLLLFKTLSWGGEELLVGYYVWLSSVGLLAAIAVMADVFYKRPEVKEPPTA